jgi:hypothetical protein
MAEILAIAILYLHVYYVHDCIIVIVDSRYGSSSSFLANSNSTTYIVLQLVVVEQST